MTTFPSKQLLLVGGGHAHIGLLREMVAQLSDGLQVTLISDAPHTLYSGMLPGWMAGHYHLDEIGLDVAALCERAGVRFVQQTIACVDASAQCVVTATADRFDYEVLSLNTGADTNLSWLTPDTGDAIIDDAGAIAIRPLSHFVQQWQKRIKAAKQADTYRLAVIGSGAAAVELVFAAHVALQKISPKHQAYLVCGEHLLAGFAIGFRRRVLGQLKRHGIEVVYERATGYRAGKVLTQTQSWPAHALIAATGVTGAAWTAHTDLQTVEGGFIAVNAYQQSLSHPNVFAVGDVATRVDQEVAHSGVHAVHGGRVSAHNLRSFLNHKPLRSYQPKKRTLYLLSCGDKYAIASFGHYSLQGRWVWYVKRYIDKHFVNAK